MRDSAKRVVSDQIDRNLRRLAHRDKMRRKKFLREQHALRGRPPELGWRWRWVKEGRSVGRPFRPGARKHTR